MQPGPGFFELAGELGRDTSGDEEDLIRNIHGVAPVAELDGDELGYLLGKVAEVKRQPK